VLRSAALASIWLPREPNAWIKNQAEEPQFVDTLKKGSKLIVKAPSLKGHISNRQLFSRRSVTSARKS